MSRTAVVDWFVAGREAEENRQRTR